MEGTCSPGVRRVWTVERWKELEQIDSLNGTGKKAVAVKVEDLALEQLSPVACLILVLTGKCGQLSIPLVSHLETHQLD